MDVLCVDPARIGEVWPHVEALLSAAFAESRGDGSADELRGLVTSGAALLWIAWDGTAIRAAAVTQLFSPPRGKVCQLLAAGGGKMSPRDWPFCIAPIERYARDEGCAFVRLEGRAGWKRVFTEYREPWIVLEKRL